jgi:tetraacyldisaccharide 4'-kinase
MGSSMGTFLDEVWYSKKRSLAHQVSKLMLSPLSWAYAAGLKVASKNDAPVDVGRPVISIGNLTVGGNGKTPLVIELIGRLPSTEKVAVVSRGYGRQSRGVKIAHLPGEGFESAQEVGDEPALIARRCPQAAVVVGEDRVAAVQKAIEVFSPDIIVCDDAFQHRRLHRDLDILAVHADKGFGNRKLLPKGPLREPITQVSRAQLIVFTHAKSANFEDLKKKHGIPEDIPVMACGFRFAGFFQGLDLKPAFLPSDRSVIAVSAVSNPRGFISSCKEADLKIVVQKSYLDHHVFTPKDILRIENIARQYKADAIVTTEKDLVRGLSDVASLPVYALRIVADWKL